MKAVLPYLTRRHRLILVAAIFGGMSAWTSDPAPSHDVAGVQAALAEQNGLQVGEIAWEPSRGLLADVTLGRAVLFEARTNAAASQDIYRAFVRVSPEGKVLGVGSPKNLTGTKRGHESGLVSRGGLAAFVTHDKDAPTSVTLLDLKGEANRPGIGLSDRVQLALTRLLETGSTSGIGRADFFLSGKAFELELTASDVTFTQDGKPQSFKTSDVFAGPAKANDDTLTSIVRLRTPIPWLHWAANTGRHFVGTGPIAWAEGRAFSLWDRLHRVSYDVVSDERRPQGPIKVAERHHKPERREVWPPEPIRLAGAKPMDGVWRPIVSELLPKDDQPLFYRTLLHPDPERPYAELHLVAMDMRRLKLGIGAGYEDPHPDTGPPGSGQIPNDATTYENVVGTFNGAFKAEHGAYGMKTEGRLLVEPVMGAATVTVDAAGSAGFGTWKEGIDTAEIAAFRQNMDPLVADGKINPHAREVWGDHLYGAGVAVERSALCLHESGQLFYGWALEATGESLASGMAAAGCTYAIHLDMNPGHCAFAVNRIQSVVPLVARGEVLDPRMKVNATRYVRWSPKDFFYLVRRAPAPQVAGIKFRPSPGEGPPPVSLPGIFHGSKSLGGLTIDVDRVDAGRLTFDVGVGSAENGGKGVSQPDAGVLIAWGLGHRTQGMRTGLTRHDDVIVPLDRAYASLTIEKGVPRLAAPDEPQAEREGMTIVQLPVLARDGKLTERGQELGGSRPRAAFCIDQQENIYVARMTHDTPAPLAMTLIELGCSLVVELDRGSRPPPLVQRAGTDQPPHAGYEQSMLYGISTQMLPRTHTF